MNSNSKDLHIFLISNTPITSKSTGPSIRMINIANTLKEKYYVTLFSQKTDESQISKYCFLSNKFWKDFIKSKVIYSQPSRFRYLFLSRLFRKKIIIDLYDPTDIENLEMYKNSNSFKSRLIKMYSSLRLKYAIKIADFFVCATEKQKDYWIGYMQGLNKIKLNDYRVDENLNNLITLLPYGIKNKNPQSENNPICEKYTSIKKSDKVFIWAGGIWNWFDSKNLILAMNDLKSRNDIKLLFLGIPDIKEKNNAKYKNTFETIELSNKLNLTNYNVFFNDEWVDYEKRHNYLLNSYAGISLHYDNLETRYSFRTRVLDYLWCNLPFIISDKDYFSEVNKEVGFAITTNCDDKNSIKNAIISLADDSNKYKEIKFNIIKEKEKYLWINVCKNLDLYLQNCLTVKRKKESLFFTSLFLLTIPFKLIISLFGRD